MSTPNEASGAQDWLTEAKRQPRPSERILMVNYETVIPQIAET